MRVFLIRHGETISNKEGRYMGITDVLLSDEGKDKIIKKVNEGYYPSYDGQTIYTSALTRTKQTLKLIYGDVEYIEEERFNESNFGDFENKTYNELKDNPDYITWISGDNFSNVCPNGESYVQMKKRVTEAFVEVVRKHQTGDKDIIIVLHSGPIVALMENLHPDIKKTYYEWRLENGDYYTLDNVLELIGEYL